MLRKLDSPDPVTLVCECSQSTIVQPKPWLRGGWYIAENEPYVCQGCLKRQEAEQQELRRQEAKAAQAMQLESVRRDIESHLMTAHVPPDFLSKSLEDLDRSQFRDFDAMRQVCVDLGKPKSLLTVTIYGPTGRGKTHLATGFLRALYLSGAADPKKRPVLFLSVYEIARQIAQASDKYRERDRIAHLVATKPWCLVIDDYGDTDNRMVRRIQYEAVMARFEKNLRTIITTNLDPDKDFKGTEERLASRLWERGAVLRRSGFPDYRRIEQPPQAKPTSAPVVQGGLF